MWNNYIPEVEKILIQYNVKWNLLRCVIIDDGKNMYGVEKMSSWIIYKACEDVRVVIHYIFH